MTCPTDPHGERGAPASPPPPVVDEGQERGEWAPWTAQISTPGRYAAGIGLGPSKVFTAPLAGTYRVRLTDGGVSAVLTRVTADPPIFPRLRLFKWGRR